MPLPRRAKAAVVSAAVLASTALTGGYPVSAEPVAAGCVADGPALRYLVLFDRGTPARTATAEIGAACGSVTVYYPEIAVAVAASASRAFAGRFGLDRAFSAEGRKRDGAEPPTGKPDETAGTRARITADPAAVPTADRTAEQWDMALIRAHEARRYSIGSRNVVVGVLDSGIDPNHPELRRALDPALSAGCLTGRPNRSRTSWAPTSSPHGTHVAGTIAAADDGKGITGVAPGVRIASVKVVDEEGYIFPEYAVCGLMWATANRMTVTNNSYFVDPWLMTCDRDGERVVFEAVRRAVDHATRQGVLTVAAATNEAANLSDSQGSAGESTVDNLEREPLSSDCRVLPAGLRGVVAVSATGPDRLKASYSSYGLGLVDVTAPGGELAKGSRSVEADRCVLSTVPNGYRHYCGTSMATPHVTGVVALLATTHPKRTPQQLTKLLTSQAEPVPCPADYDLRGTGAQDAYCTGYAPFNSFHGHGMVDALAAVTD